MSNFYTTVLTVVRLHIYGMPQVLLPGKIPLPQVIFYVFSWCWFA